MIIPVKKGKWSGPDAKALSNRQLTAGGYTATEYKAGGIQYWACFDGTTSPRFSREYQATNWFRDRARALMEGISND